MWLHGENPQLVKRKAILVKSLFVSVRTDRDIGHVCECLLAVSSLTHLGLYFSHVFSRGTHRENLSKTLIPTLRYFNAHSIQQGLNILPLIRRCTFSLTTLDIDGVIERTTWISNHTELKWVWIDIWHLTTEHEQMYRKIVDDWPPEKSFTLSVDYGSTTRRVLEIRGIGARN